MFMAKSSDMVNAMNKQAYLKMLVLITPEHIQTALMELKTRSKKSSYYAFLSEAISLFETRGLIKPFNLSVANGGRSRIPTTIPIFLRGYCRNRVRETDTYANQIMVVKDTCLFC